MATRVKRVDCMNERSGYVGEGGRGSGGGKECSSTDRQDRMPQEVRTDRKFPLNMSARRGVKMCPDDVYFICQDGLRSTETNRYRNSNMNKNL